ncbi:MAG: terminase, partial [Oscillospiraceae bacterium]|nr:terminase [Oscillospiraceae bacterium]
LEAINWYIAERTKYNDHAHMASEYPSDDVEAFTHSGARVFDKYQVEAFRPHCRAPKLVGDVSGNGQKGREALENLRFTEDGQGVLCVWHLPEVFPDMRVLYRYLVVVDIGGRSRTADWSVIAVFDRYDMIDGGKPALVAQWRGHTDHDLLAWKAAQIAAFYDNALLVIESNTLETKDNDRDVDGDQSGYILNQIRDVYSNLYARSVDTENIKEGVGVKYGFHTNVKTKAEIISNLIECVRERLYIERDEGCLDELLTYEKTDRGVYQAIEGMHDDRLMTRAIGLWICFRVMDMPIVDDTTNKRYYVPLKT